MKYCHECGNEIKPTAKFCGKCGQALIPFVEKAPKAEVTATPIATIPSSPKQFASPEKVNIKKKNKIGVYLFLLVLIAGIGYVGWKYAWPYFMKQGSDSFVASAPFKTPEKASIQETDSFGLVPINQFGIVLKDNLEKSAAEKIAQQVGGTITGELELINFFQLETPLQSAAAFNRIFQVLQNTAGVELVVPNSLLLLDEYDESKGTCDPLDDPMYKDTATGRHYEMIGLKNAYALIRASGLELNPVKVGILDNQLYKPCDELGGTTKVSSSDKEDFNDIPSKDDMGAVINGGLTHGTMVNQIIGANANNGGVTGVASPLGDKMTMQTTNIYKTDDYVVSTPDPEDPAKIVSKKGVTYVHTALKALEDQIKNGATVINCSFGPTKYKNSNKFETKLYEKFYKIIQEKYPKVVIVGSAGNSNAILNGINGSNKGQKVDNLITVGALNPDGQKSTYSNYANANAEVSISAPADDMIHGTTKDGQPIRASGTSFAAPQVTGTVALIQSLNPNLTAKEIKDILQSSADKVINGRDRSTPIPPGMGTGMLRVDQAILKVINDLRSKKGLPPLTIESATALNAVELSYSGGPEAFTIKANIKSLLKSSVVCNIEISGNNYSLSGSASKTLSSPGILSWGLTTQKGNKLTAKVTRNDTHTCAWVVIESVDFTGIWKVMGKVTSAKLDASLGAAKDMSALYGADKNEVEAGQREAEQSMIGKENPLGTIDVEVWKSMGCKIEKEGNLIVVRPPGSDNPKALGSMIYYIENLGPKTFTGYAIAKNHLGGRDNEIHYSISGTLVEK